MDFLDQLMTYDPGTDPFILAYDEWSRTGTIETDPREIIGIGGAMRDFSPEEFIVQTSNYIRRDAFIQRFGFCVPLPPLVEFLKSNGPVLEVGAGLGFVSRLVAAAGGKIRATDASPSTPDVEHISAADAIRQDGGASLVFCAWPSLNGDWFGEALQEMTSGQKLLYIGEGNGGATASESFFSQIGNTLLPLDLPDGADFNLRFYGIHDAARLFVRA